MSLRSQVRRERRAAHAKAMATYGLYLDYYHRCRASRPFLHVGGNAHLCMLILAMIGELEKACLAAEGLGWKPKVEEYRQDIVTWRKKLDDIPPPLGPAAARLPRAFLMLGYSV